MTGQLQISADVLTNERIQINITNFPSGAICECACMVSKLPNQGEFSAVTRSVFSPEATDEEKAVAQQTIYHVLKTLIRPMNMREMTSPELTAAIQPRN